MFCCTLVGGFCVGDSEAAGDSEAVGDPEADADDEVVDVSVESPEPPQPATPAVVAPPSDANSERRDTFVRLSLVSPVGSVLSSDMECWSIVCHGTAAKSIRGDL